MSKVSILDVEFDSITMVELLERIPKIIEDNNSRFIVTANPEIVMQARKDKDFNEIINEAEIVTADGIGIIIASKIFGKSLPERVTGVEIVKNLFSLGNRNGYKFYLLGAKKGVAHEAAQKVKKEFPNIKIVGSQHGYFENEEEIINDIKHKHPDVLLVALGMGRQEKWIWKHRGRLSVPLAIGVGGTFDVLAERVKRAPEWIQKLGLEWLFRLIQEPSRLRRMLVLPQFLVLVIKTRIKEMVSSGHN